MTLANAMTGLCSPGKHCILYLDKRDWFHSTILRGLCVWATLHAYLDPKHVSWNNDMQLKVTAKGCRVVINTFLLWSVQWNCCYREIDKVTIHLQVITFLLCFNAFLSLNHISQRRAHTVYELSKFIVTHSRKYSSLSAWQSTFLHLPLQQNSKFSTDLKVWAALAWLLLL